MGINGLLPLLKSIHKPCSVKKFDGKTLAVDAYGWLHRGTVACAMELALGKPTRKYVDFCMHRVRMLQHYGVTPYIVFDGDYLPSKGGTETERLNRRSESKKAGLELLSAGKKALAYLEFQKAVDVSPEMARLFIDELKKSRVQYVVAPYEADAQMVYLERQGIVDGILSEDSDLLVFGAKCLLTKLDQYGNCIEVNKADFSACKEISLTGWSETEFRRMAILSGCDYLPSVKNMGLKTAYRLIRKHKTIEKVLRMLQFDGTHRIPDGYLSAFYQAEFTFLHQFVYCPKSEALVPHTQPDPPLDLAIMPYLGCYIEPHIAKGVATGDLNPMTKLPITPSSGKMASPLTPWTKSKTRSQDPASSDPKNPKPMDKYTKKRMPLAELDINLFTHSPSQQDLLRRNTGIWDASPVRPYLQRTRTQPRLPTLPRSATPTMVNDTTTHDRTPTIPESRPPKRARLCDNEGLPASPQSGQNVETYSRFFRAPIEPSPTVGKLSRARKAKKGDITIFSDDSIEDAMLGLPDFDGFDGAKAKKIGAFEDGQVTDVQALRQSSLALSPAEVIAVNPSQDSTPDLTQSTSTTTSFNQPDSPSAIPSQTLATCLKRYSFGVTDATITIHGQITPASTTRKQSCIPTPVKSTPASKSKPLLPTTGNMSALQRLGASATNRLKPLAPSATPTVLQKHLYQPRRSLLSQGGSTFSELCKKIIDPAMVPLPVADDTENILLMAGSEDYMIHDSEEDEPLSQKAHQQLDLSHFAHTAA
ncbi:hypothetical protein BJ878DRAFT_539249 [Calycina marina]|uniref:Exonuclease 1 n=1 Tax=Calycina marina TaxID=1763456 RepID=A0A9P7Z8N2_9HELO|nr:hypothetical protein BJ878DRAFT_539249 [Calycina marina]